jgi:hypothetical protein
MLTPVICLVSYDLLVFEPVDIMDNSRDMITMLHSQLFRTFFTCKINILCTSSPINYVQHERTIN